MPRLMSVALTEDQVRARTKYRTRRLGWEHVKIGDELTLCRKVMGRRRRCHDPRHPGHRGDLCDACDGTGWVVDPLVRICDVVVVDVARCQLSVRWGDDPAAEGFPEWTYDEFVEFFCEHMRCTPDTVVTVITWRYLG